MLARKYELEEYSEAADRDLENSLPLLEETQASSNALSANDINELKSMNNPPQKTKDVLDGVLIAFNYEKGWKNAKKLISDINFLSTIKEFDKENMSDEMIDELSTHMQEKNISR